MEPVPHNGTKVIVGASHVGVVMDNIRFVRERNIISN